MKNFNINSNRQGNINNFKSDHPPKLYDYNFLYSQNYLHHLIVLVI